MEDCSSVGGTKKSCVVQFDRLHGKRSLAFLMPEEKKRVCVVASDARGNCDGLSKSDCDAKIAGE